MRRGSVGSSYFYINYYYHAVPSASPRNVYLQANSSTSLIVAWDPVPLVYQNGVITAYEVLYQSSELFSDTIRTQTANVSGFETSMILEGLQEFVEYDILVRAQTEKGPGPYGETMKIRTLEDGMLSL